MRRSFCSLFILLSTFYFPLYFYPLPTVISFLFLLPLFLTLFLKTASVYFLFFVFFFLFFLYSFFFLLSTFHFPLSTFYFLLSTVLLPTSNCYFISFSSAFVLNAFPENRKRLFFILCLCFFLSSLFFVFVFFFFLSSFYFPLSTFHFLLFYCGTKTFLFFPQYFLYISDVHHKTYYSEGCAFKQYYLVHSIKIEQNRQSHINGQRSNSYIVRDYGQKQNRCHHRQTYFRLEGKHHSNQ